MNYVNMFGKTLERIVSYNGVVRLKTYYEFKLFLSILDANGYKFHGSPTQPWTSWAKQFDIWENHNHNTKDFCVRFSRKESGFCTSGYYKKEGHPVYDLKHVLKNNLSNFLIKYLL